MTLRQMIQADCANWRRPNRCLFGRADEPQCSAQAGEQCAYFERAVAPLADTRPEYAAAVAEYQAAKVKLFS